MKIAYGTYAMPTMPLEEAFPTLARIGYDGVEICLSSRHVGATADQMDTQRRTRLRDLLRGHGLGVPAIFILGGIYTPNQEDHQANLERMRVCAGLARDLGMDEPPVLATGFGGRNEEWDAIKRELVEQLRDYAEVAEQEDFILAGEAHAGAAVNCSERIVWLLDEVAHPRIRLHFRRHEDGTFELVLLGQGELDAATYVRAMRDAGWEGYITLEVSAMVWSQDDYDPVAAAEFCYESLTTAFERAGAPRG